MTAAAPRLPPTMHFVERDWLSSNNVLFVSPEATAIVDTGYVKHRDLTLALVRRVLGDRPLDLLVNTHLHSDHCGGNALLQSTWRCRTLIPRGSANVVRNWDTRALHLDTTGQRCDRFGHDGVLAEGDEIELGRLRWRVIAAPGHDPDAVVLHCADEGILITADALWRDGFGVIFPELEGESGFAEQRAILERIAALDVAIAIPGHGPMFTDVGDAIARAHARLDYLGADRGRNAAQATKVLLKFLLLDREEIPLERVAPLLESLELIRGANLRYLGLPAAELAERAVGALLKAGVARVDGGLLRNA
jgi:glyoxylase-like metal-dependent hydrolase (beta-lactamase superfamily II)